MSESSPLATRQDPVTGLELEQNEQAFIQMLREAVQNGQTGFEFRPIVSAGRTSRRPLSRQPDRVRKIRYEIAVAISIKYFEMKEIKQIGGLVPYGDTVMQVKLAPPR